MLIRGNDGIARSMFITSGYHNSSILNDFVFQVIYRISMIINAIVSFNLIEEVNRTIDRKKNKNA